MTEFHLALRAALDQEGTAAAEAYRRLRDGPATTAEDMDALAYLAGRAGDAKAAVGWRERASTLAPSAARWRALGRARTANNDYYGSETAWRHAVDTDKTAIEGWIGLGEALRELTRWDMAARCFQQVVQSHPSHASGWGGLALSLVNHGDLPAGVAAAQTALDRDPACVDAHRAIAIAALKTQRLEDAEQACLAALRLVPRSPEALATLALTRMAQNRLAEADALFLEAVAAKPGFAEAIGNHAATLARLGRKDDAKREAARAIRLKPFLPAPPHLLGALMRDEGRFDEAAAAFAHVLTIAPGHLEARLNLVNSLRLSGKPAETAAACRMGLEQHPNHPALLLTLGAVLRDAGSAAEALRTYQQALDHHPALVDAHNGVGLLHRDAGRLEDAIRHFHQAIALQPGNAGLLRNLGFALLDQGRLEEAAARAREALGFAPADPANHRLLAHVLTCLGQLAEALDVMRAGVDLAPTDARSCAQAAAIALKLGNRSAALAYSRQAIKEQPHVGRHWLLFSQSIKRQALTAPDPGLRQDLRQALIQPGAEHSDLIDAAVSAVLLEPALAAAHAAIHAADPHPHADPASALAPLLREPRLLRGLADDDLLLTVLETVIITDPALERTLTVLRRALLNASSEQGVGPLSHPGWLPVLAALAQQCFLNEYVFAESPEEAAAVEALGTALLDDLQQGLAPSMTCLALFAAYRPLSVWPEAVFLDPKAQWPTPIRRLIERQVEDRRAEAALAAATPRLTPMDRSPVSEQVRAQYESNPYPRWLDAGLLDAPMPLPNLLRAMFPRLALDSRPGWQAPDILIAGCGTGRESVWTANQIANARILAVDLSLASLAYAQRQTHKLGGAAIEYAQADLMELGTLERRFDVIQSAGVLHHLADPLAGWRTLTGLLRPGGLMKIGLYSEKARRVVVQARAWIAQRGYESSPADIRRFRQDVLALPDDDPIRVLVGSPDFHNLSACRDLVFHVQEHRLTLPQITEWIAELGLEFIGFQLRDPALGEHYRQRFPDDPGMMDLDLWDRFEDENPSAFAGMYEFWVRDRR